MKNLNLPCVAVLAAVVMVVAPSFVGPSLVRAGTIGPTVTTTPIPTTKTDWGNTLSFPQFNPAQGTLTQVALQFSSSLDTILTVQDLSGSGSVGSTHAEVQVAVSDPNNGLIADQPQLDLSSPSYPFSLAANQTLVSGLLTKTQTSGIYDYTDPRVLSEFTGLGTISLSASTSTSTWVNYTSGNVDSTQVTHANATGWVTYTFTPVPRAVHLCPPRYRCRRDLGLCMAAKAGGLATALPVTGDLSCRLRRRRLLGLFVARSE